MDLVTVVLRLEFVEAMRPWLELRDLFRVAGEQQTAEIQGQPVVVLRQQRKERITLQIRGLVFEQETAKSLVQAVGQSLALVDQLNQVSPIPRLRFTRLDAMFVEAYQLPFHELLARTKEEFFRPQALVSAATDIGLTLDIADGDETNHMQIGPMMPPQLQADFLVFPRDRLPAQFLFISLGRSRTIADGYPYERDVLEIFLKQTTQWQSTESQAIAASIAGGRRV